MVFLFWPIGGYKHLDDSCDDTMQAFVLVLGI